MDTEEDWKVKRKTELEATIPDGWYTIGSPPWILGTGKGGYIQFLLALEEEMRYYGYTIEKKD